MAFEFLDEPAFPYQREKQRVHIDEDGRLIPYESEDNQHSPTANSPKYSVGELLFLSAAMGVNVTLAGLISIQIQQANHAEEAAIAAAMLTVSWFYSSHRGIPAVDKQAKTRGGRFGWWFYRLLPTLVLGLVWWLASLDIALKQNAPDLKNVREQLMQELP